MNQPPTATGTIEEQLREVLNITFPGDSKANVRRRQVALERFCCANNAPKDRTQESIAGRCGMETARVNQILKKDIPASISSQSAHWKSLTDIISAIHNELKKLEYVVAHDEFMKQLAAMGITSTPLVFEGIAELSQALNHPLPAKVVKFRPETKEFIIPEGLGKHDAIDKIRTAAGARATKYGGVYPYEAFLLEEVCGVIPEPRRSYYVRALLESETEYRSLGKGRYFCFTEAGYEPLRTQLRKIFLVYHSEIPLQNLLKVIGNPQRKSIQREPNNAPKLEVLEQCRQVYDEYCLEMGYWAKADETMRVCGPKLKKLIRDNDTRVADIRDEEKDIFKAECALVEALRANGQPMEQSAFTAKLKSLVPADHNQKHIVSFPTLLWRDGLDRHMTSHILDDKYGGSVVTEEQIEKAVSEEDYDRETLVKLRKEQVSLRNGLLKVHATFDKALRARVAKCECCHRSFPEDLVVAAHVKKRSECSPDEVGDTDNIAMLLCVTCDKLYENGYFAIGPSGYFVLTKNRLHETVKNLLKEVDGKLCEYWFVNDRRKKYCEHRYNQGNFI